MWVVGYCWWGKADIYRFCTDDEWDGGLRVNGRKALYHPNYSEATLEFNEAKRIVDELNQQLKETP